MHLVAKGQRYDSLHKGFMFFKELNVFIYILTLETVGRKRICWKNKIFRSKCSSGCFHIVFEKGQEQPLVSLRPRGR